MNGFTKLMVEIPRWGLVLLIIYAPWAYGSVGGIYLDGLIYGSAAVFVLWVLSCLIRRKLRYSNLICLLILSCLLFQGWGMTLNSKFIYDQEFSQFLPISSRWPGWPGSIDESVSWDWMLRITALFGIIIATMDISQNPIWRHRLVGTMVIAGGSIAGLGLAQHLLSTPIVWPSGMINVWPFATFLYHGNAGAYLNIVLPLSIGVTLTVFRNRAFPLSQAFWVCVVSMIVSAPFINASKGATPITLLLLLVIVIWQVRRRIYEAATTQSWKTTCVGSIIIIGAIAAIILATGPDVAIERWTHALNNPEMVTQGRLGVSQVCLKMLPKAGLWGLGPDTFHIAFPFYTVDLGNQLYGFWRYAHQDYLQTLVEWGKLGAMMWGLLLFGGAFIMALNYIRYRNRYGSRDRSLLFAVPLSILGVLIHSLYDFPLQIGAIQCYTAILLGLAWSSGKWRMTSNSLSGK